MPVTIQYRLQDLIDTWNGDERHEGERLTLREFARRTGLSHQLLSNLRNATEGQVITSVAVIAVLCNFFRCQPSDLFEVTWADPREEHVDRLLPNWRRAPRRRPAAPEE